jgi:hypothetical protein
VLPKVRAFGAARSPMAAYLAGARPAIDLRNWIRLIARGHFAPQLVQKVQKEGHVARSLVLGGRLG